jgi:sec-independent protein translocase protein TatB
VLGPEKLPRVVAEIGRWVGRARVMARQFREQLEEEVQLEQARKAEAAAAAARPAAAPDPAAATPPEPSAAMPETAAAPAAAAASEATAAASAAPEILRTATFSHAHPTDATGADPTAVRAAVTASADEPGA